MTRQTQRNLVLQWTDVKQKVLGIIGENKPWGDGPNHRHSHYLNRLRGLAKDPYTKNTWEGGSGAQTLDWLRNGYRAKEFLHSAAYVPMGKKPRPKWGDEDGEVDPGRLMGGFDDFMLDRADVEKKPGLRVMIEFGFSAGLKAQVIRDYGAWVAGLLGALEATGYDLTVDIWVNLNNLYGGDLNVRTNLLIRVKNQNEVMDFTDWSALFAPTGYRHIIFTAKLMGGDKIGKLATSGLGSCVGGKTWGLSYDKESSTLKITVDQLGYHTLAIPELNKQAVELGLIPSADDDL